MSQAFQTLRLSIIISLESRDSVFCNRHADRACTRQWPHAKSWRPLITDMIRRWRLTASTIVIHMIATLRRPSWIEPTSMTIRRGRFGLWTWPQLLPTPSLHHQKLESFAVPCVGQVGHIGRKFWSRRAEEGSDHAGHGLRSSGRGH